MPSYTETVSRILTTHPGSRFRGQALAFAVITVVSLQAGWLVSRSEGQVSKPLLGLGALALGILMFRLSAERLFLGWIFLAPLLQESASATPLGHALALALYTAPPVVLVCKLLLDGIQGQRVAWFDLLPAIYVVYVFGSLLATTHLLSDTPVGTARGFYETVAMGALVYYIVVFGSIRRVAATQICFVILWACALQAVMSILDFGFAWNLWNDQGWRRPGDLARSVATLANPALLGTFLGIGIVISLAVLCWEGPQKLRRPSIAVLILAPAGLIVTFTRGPILAAFLVGGICLIASRRSRLLGLGLVAVAALVLAAAWPKITSSPVYQSRISERSNVETRVLLQDISLRLAAEKPLTGWGYDSFDRVKTTVDLGTTNSAAYRDAIAATSHDTFLTVLVNYGGIGLTLLLLPWLVIIGRALRQARRPSPDRWLLIGASSSVVVVVLSAATFDLRFFSFIPMLPWLFIALLRRITAAKGALPSTS